MPSQDPLSPYIPFDVFFLKLDRQLPLMFFKPFLSLAVGYELRLSKRLGGLQNECYVPQYDEKGKQERSVVREYELKIILADECPIAGSKDLNKVGQEARRWSLSDSEVQFLAQTINDNDSIQNVLFTTGESSLCDDKVQILLARIHRPVSFALNSSNSRPEDLPALHEEPLDGTCPSLDESITLKGPTKTVFFPCTGFTPCWGPLAFDAQLEESQLFSKNFQDCSNSWISLRLNAGNFRSQFKEAGFDVSKITFCSACKACSSLYGKSAPSVPSLHSISTKADFQVYPTESRLDPIREQLLSQSYHVGYVYKGYLQPPQHEPLCKTVVEEVISTEKTKEQALNFIIENYYNLFSQYYSEKDIKLFEKASEEYFKLSLNKRIYRKNGSIVGCFLANSFENYPLLDIPTVHVGYWGYNKIQVDKEEANFMKFRWQKHLFEMSNGELPVDVSVAAFNPSGQHFVNKLGLTLTAIRLDPRA